MTERAVPISAATTEPTPDQRWTLLLSWLGHRGWLTPTDCAAALHRQGLEGLALALHDRGNVTLAPAVRSQAEQWLQAARLEQGLYTAVLGEVALALQTAGIDHVALKGPILADRLWPAPVVRRCSDLDLLVTPGDFPIAERVLTQLGFALAQPKKARSDWQWHQHRAWQRPLSPLIELHFCAFRGLGAQMPTADLLARSQPWQGAYAPQTRILTAMDELLYLAAHAAGHHFERDVWLLDWAMLLQSQAVWPWDQGLVQAEHWRVRQALAATLVAAQELVGGVQLPQGVAASLPLPWQRRVQTWRNTLNPLEEHGLRRYGLHLACSAATCDGAQPTLRWLGQTLGKTLAEAPTWLRRRRDRQGPRSTP